MKTLTAAAVDLPDRFWSKVNLLGECWEWSAERDGNGYGRFSVGGGMEGAHRVAYAFAVGPIPVELELDHLCRNRGCVNPKHLEPVTHAENCRRGIAAEVNGLRQRGITHCPVGHPYDEANTQWKSGGRRSCRACAAARRRTPEHRERSRLTSARYRARQQAVTG